MDASDPLKIDREDPAFDSEAEEPAGAGEEPVRQRHPLLLRSHHHSRSQSLGGWKSSSASSSSARCGADPSKDEDGSYEDHPGIPDSAADEGYGPYPAIDWDVFRMLGGHDPKGDYKRPPRNRFWDTYSLDWSAPGLPKVSFPPRREGSCPPLQRRSISVPPPAPRLTCMPPRGAEPRWELLSEGGFQTLPLQALGSFALEELEYVNWDGERSPSNGSLRSLPPPAIRMGSQSVAKAVEGRGFDTGIDWDDFEPSVMSDLRSEAPSTIDETRSEASLVLDWSERGLPNRATGRHLLTRLGCRDTRPRGAPRGPRAAARRRMHIIPARRDGTSSAACPPLQQQASVVVRREEKSNDRIWDAFQMHRKRNNQLLAGKRR